ncbi:MAG: ChbG/HpnK family deacetylase [Nitrospirae bacterium]|nr:ChbG/HpnK family deacetylase [Nitrospirota bacterium]
MAKDINSAISELTKKKIVSKVSVMAYETTEIISNDFDKNVEIGLHINLTANTTLIGMDQSNNLTLPKLLYLIYTRQLTKNKIIDNIKHQHNVIKSKGFQITYMDTHQHIHIIPKVMNSLIHYAQTAGIFSIRCITLEKKNMFFYIFSLIRYGFLLQVPKMMILYFMGYFMKRKLDNAKIRYSKNLVLMPLATGGNYEDLLKEFINRFRDKDFDTEIVSHPGLGTENRIDSYIAGRLDEYRSLLNTHIRD